MRLLTHWPPVTLPDGVPMPSTDVEAVLPLLSRCPAHAPTPLADATGLAERAGVARVHVKDERARMGLGSFKALGAAYVIARAAADGVTDETWITASAGNHGLSVAAGARVFGHRAVVVIAETVPEAFAERLRAEGAEVVRHGAEYEAAMAHAAALAEERGYALLSDSSWDGYTAPPLRLMEGYTVLMRECFDAMDEAPTHIFLQAGVGGLAAACAAMARRDWGREPGRAPFITVVEPEAAPALMASVEAGKPVHAPGPVSAMGRLDCKEPSFIALAGLARDADAFATITEAEAADAMPVLAQADLATTPSGGAGLAALLASGDHREALRLDRNSRVLAILSEVP